MSEPIRFRPLTIGDMWGIAFKAIKRNPAATIGFGALQAILVGIASYLLRIALPENPTRADLDVSQFLPAIVVFLAGLVIGSVGAAAFPAVIQRATLGHHTTFAQALAFGLAKFWRVLGLNLTLTIAVIAGALVAAGLAAISSGLGIFVFVVLAFVAFYLAIALSFAAPALVIEDLGIIAAIRRSIRLVKGSWWRILGILLLTSIVVGLPTGVISLIIDGRLAETPSLAAQIITAVLSVFTIPFTSSVVVLLYLDRRIRTEGMLWQG